MKNKKTLLAENISKRRKALGFNQDDLAERIGVHVNTIKNIERGLSEGQPDTRKAIAEALGCELWELMGPQHLEPHTPPTVAPQSPHSGDRAHLILDIQSRLTTLNERELRLTLGFLDDLAAHSAGSTGASDVG